MGTPKVNYSDAVLRAATQIMGFGGKKNKIDTRYEYDKLGQLLTDVNQGKLDKNTIEKDRLYVRGLQIEYEQRYLGEDCARNGATNPINNGHGEQAQPVKREKPAVPAKENPGNIPKTQPEPKPEQPKPEPNHAIPPKTDTPKKPAPKNPPKTKPGKTQVPQPKITNKGNNNADNGSVVVTGDNNHIFLGATAAGKAAAEAGATEAAKAAEEKKMIDKSKQNYTAAFAEGRQVAKDLIGYTTTQEKQNAIRYIMKQSPETIMGFISGFNENDTVLGISYGQGGLLDQVDNEYGWTESEKKEVFTKVISTTLNWAKALGFENDPNYKSLESILKQLNEKGQIDTERADLLIKELVTKGMARAGV